jgi:hypothetical protein
MRWLDDVSMDLRKTGVNERRERARHREASRLIVERTKAHPGLQRHLEEKVMKFLCQVTKALEIQIKPEQTYVINTGFR